MFVRVPVQSEVTYGTESGSTTTSYGRQSSTGSEFDEYGGGSKNRNAFYGELYK